jgi:hypothetical protein
LDAVSYVNYYLLCCQGCRQIVLQPFKSATN